LTARRLSKIAHFSATIELSTDQIAGGQQPVILTLTCFFLELKRTRGRFKSVNALSNWPRNRLLLALPSRNLTRLMPELEHTRCQRGQILMDADSSLDHVFFPDSFDARRALSRRACWARDPCVTV
jgi:hypothetical protein